MLFYNILIFYMTILIYKICTNIQTSTSDRMIHSDLFEADLILRRIIAHIRYFFFPAGCRDNCLSSGFREAFFGTASSKSLSSRRGEAWCHSVEPVLTSWASPFVSGTHLADLILVAARLYGSEPTLAAVVAPARQAPSNSSPMRGLCPRA